MHFRTVSPRISPRCAEPNPVCLDWSGTVYLVALAAQRTFSAVCSSSFKISDRLVGFAGAELEANDDDKDGAIEGVEGSDEGKVVDKPSSSP